MITVTPAAASAQSRRNELVAEHHDTINFGDIPDAINDILQEGVVACCRDKKRADALFRKALAAAPTKLPVYYCLYKIHTYQGNLDDALAMAERGLKEGARQAGWPLDWRERQPQPEVLDGPGRFALYTLKVVAFISLRRDEQDRARDILNALKGLDPAGRVGWPLSLRWLTAFDLWRGGADRIGLSAAGTPLAEESLETMQRGVRKLLSGPAPLNLTSES